MIHWYALHSKPQKERQLCGSVCAQGMECYFPCLRCSPVNPRARKEKPYFSGYIFVQTDLDEVGKNYFRWFPNSLGLVRFGDEPAVVPDPVIASIRRAVEALEEGGREHVSALQVGDEVLIKGGPFDGYRAVFNARLSDQQRVCVLLKMLADSREIQLELEASKVRKIEN